METREEVIARYMRDAVQKAISLYNHGVKEGSAETYNIAYSNGLSDAWSVIKEAMEMPMSDFERLFDGAECLEDVKHFTIEEIRDIVRRYEAEREETIEVGDEVIDINGLKAVVTNTDTHYHLFYPLSGKTWKAPKSARLKKTGRKFSHIEMLPF